MLVQYKNSSVRAETFLQISILTGWGCSNEFRGHVFFHLHGTKNMLALCLTNQVWSSFTPSLLTPLFLFFSPSLTSASFCLSLNRAVVFWGLPSCLFPIVWIFLCLQFFSSALHIHLYFHLLLLFHFFFFPLALTGVPLLQGLAEGYYSLHYSMRAGHRLDVRACVCVGLVVCFFFSCLFCSVGKERNENAALFPGFFIPSCKWMHFKEIRLNLKRKDWLSFAVLDKCNQLNKSTQPIKDGSWMKKPSDYLHQDLKTANQSPDCCFRDRLLVKLPILDTHDIPAAFLHMCVCVCLRNHSHMCAHSCTVHNINTFTAHDAPNTQMPTLSP